MIIRNYFGTAFDFVSNLKAQPYHATTIDFDTYSEDGCTIYVMNGTIPDTDVLYETDDITDFETKYGQNIVTKFENQTFEYNFDLNKKEKIVRKIPDALDFIYTIDASIGWVAVFFKEEQETFFGDFINYDWTYHNQNGEGAGIDLSKAFDPSTTVYADINKYGTEHTLEYKVPRELSKKVSKFEVHFYKDNIDAQLSVILEGSNDNITFIELSNVTQNVSSGLSTFTGNVENPQNFKYYRFRFVSESNINWKFYKLYYIKLWEINHNAIFTDSVGVWEDENKVVTLANINGAQGSVNSFKDFTLALRDTADLEESLLPVITYDIDNNPGAIILNPISSDGILTNIEKTHDLVIDGRTIDIEDGQILTLTVNGKDYTTPVSSNVWTITIPSADLEVLTPSSNYEVFVKVRDVAGNLATAQESFSTEGANEGPIIDILNTLVTDEDTEISTSITISDSPEGVASYNVTALHGTVSIDDPATTLTYLPDANYNGTDTITITAVDTIGGQSVKEVTVTVNSVNDTPILSCVDSISLDEDTSKEIILTITDDSTSYTITATALNGQVIVDDTNNILTYIPNSDYNGTDTISIEVRDDGDLTALKDVNVTVNPINDAPTIDTVDSITIDEDTTKEIAISLNDIDGTVTLVSYSALNGSVTYDDTNSKIVYVPNENYNGTDTITLVASDGTLETTKTIDVTINPLNDAPIFNIINSKRIDVNSTTTIDLLITDDSISFDVVASALNGVVSLNDTQDVLTYTPNTDFNDIDTVTVTATDTEGLTTTQDILITVDNIPSIVSVDTIITDEDTSTSFDLSITASRAYTINTSSTNGTATYDETTGKVTYTPNANYNGTDNVTIIVTDDLQVTNAKDIVVTVNSINDAPVINSIDTISTDEDTIVTIDVTISDDDIVSLTSYTANNGTVTYDETTGKITYAPNANYNGTDIITLVATDSNNVTSTKTIDVTVNSVNDAPVIDIANTISVNTDSLTDIPFTITDVENDTMTVTASALNGSVSVSSTKISYDAPSIEGTDTITVNVTDGTYTTVVTIDVTINAGV